MISAFGALSRSAAAPAGQSAPAHYLQLEVQRNGRIGRNSGIVLGRAPASGAWYDHLRRDKREVLGSVDMVFLLRITRNILHLGIVAASDSHENGTRAHKKRNEKKEDDERDVHLR